MNKISDFNYALSGMNSLTMSGRVADATYILDDLHIYYYTNVQSVDTTQCRRSARREHSESKARHRRLQPYPLVNDWRVSPAEFSRRERIFDVARVYGVTVERRTRRGMW